MSTDISSSVVMTRGEIEQRLNDEKILMIKRMTSYDTETVVRKLEEFEGDFEKVISDFMGIKKEPVTNKVVSTNQEVFKQIRQQMDQASQNFYK